MAFVRMPGITGLVYVPDEQEHKKHPCNDCYSCRWCSDEKCLKCFNKKEGCRKEKKNKG